MTAKLVLTMHEDPGHGWLEVPITLLKALGITKDVSTYSYVRGDNAYLEEDCDYAVFMRAIQKANNWDVDIKEEVVRNGDSPIRGYNHYNSAAIGA